MTDTTYTPEDLTALTDQLLLNITEHLRKEYDQGRISGTDYAMVYTSSIQSAMQQAHQFLLQKDIAGYQADITYEQKLQAMNQTEVSDGTKANQILMVQTQLDTADEQLTMLRERHGINLTPEYT